MIPIISKVNIDKTITCLRLKPSIFSKVAIEIVVNGIIIGLIYLIMLDDPLLIIVTFT